MTGHFELFDPFGVEKYINDRISSVFGPREEFHVSDQAVARQNPYPSSLISEPKNSLKSIRLDITETKKEFIIKAEMPGLKKEQINANVDENGYLTISAEKKEDRKEEDEKKHLVEHYYGKVSRSIRLPSTANINKPAAKFDDGVLTLTFPKLEEEKQARNKILIQ